VASQKLVKKVVRPAAVFDPNRSYVFILAIGFLSKFWKIVEIPMSARKIYIKYPAIDHTSRLQEDPWK
jgi:hypothetical protein